MLNLSRLLLSPCLVQVVTGLQRGMDRPHRSLVHVDLLYCQRASDEKGVSFTRNVDSIASLASQTDRGSDIRRGSRPTTAGLFVPLNFHVYSGLLKREEERQNRKARKKNRVQRSAERSKISFFLAASYSLVAIPREVRISLLSLSFSLYGEV